MKYISFTFYHKWACKCANLLLTSLVWCPCFCCGTWQFLHFLLCTSSSDQSYWVHPLKEFHPSRREAWQLPNGPRKKGQLGVHYWLWAGQEVPWCPHTPAHPLQGEQEPDGHCTLRLHKHPSGNWWALLRLLLIYLFIITSIVSYI